MTTKRPKKPANKRRLNELLIRRLQKQAAPYLVWDTVQRGLAIRVEITGFRSYKCIYSRHGRPRHYSIGPVDVISLAAARLKASKIMVQVYEGADPAADRKAERSAGTFGELAERYRDHAKTKNKSWDQADALVKKHLLPHWSKLRPGHIARSDVKSMMARITAKIVANQVLAAASAIFTWAIKEEVGGVKVNPCIGIERNPTKSRERILSDSEIVKFWNAFDAAGIEGVALKTILLCGQRPGEVTHMHVKHLIDGIWWEMPGEPDLVASWPGTKNAQSHRVALSEAVQALIADLQPDVDEFVFKGSRGGPIQNLDRAMRLICEELEVERATPHDLRRSFGSMVTRLGFGRPAMDRILNHRDSGVGSVYDRYAYANEDRQIMEAVADQIVAVVQGNRTDNVVRFEKAK
jgi:integrase